MKTIPLTKGLFAKVDDADYDELMRHKWRVQISGNGRPYAARTVTIDGRRKARRRYTVVYMHHAIVGKPDVGEVDHFNGDSLDNQRGNLRTCTHSQNILNSVNGRKPGVFFCRMTGRYAARVSVEGKRIFLGRYDTFEEAASVVAAQRAQP